jgi:hypothetical protein
VQSIQVLCSGSNREGSKLVYIRELLLYYPVPWYILSDPRYTAELLFRTGDESSSTDVYRQFSACLLGILGSEYRGDFPLVKGGEILERDMC